MLVPGIVLTAAQNNKVAGCPGVSSYPSLMSMIATVPTPTLTLPA